MNRGGSTTFSVSDSNIKSGVAKGVGNTINDPASERVREREGGGRESEQQLPIYLEVGSVPDWPVGHRT